MNDEQDKQRDEAAEGGHVWPEPETGTEAPTEEAPSGAGASGSGASPGDGPAATAGTAGARRLLRSRDDRVIAGVSGGLGRYFNIDPVIVRIGFAVTIFFGGLGVLAYIAAALFVPADDGTGNPAPPQRGRAIVRAAGIVLIALVAFGLFGTVIGAAAFATGTGYGLAVVGAIVLIGVALIALSGRGGAKWLLVPALALTIGVGVAAAADLDLSGGLGERDYRPASAAAIPAGGYELGAGRLAVDLRGIDWSPSRVLDLDVRVGAGEAVIAVPADVCVVGSAHAGAGELTIAGQHAEGLDVDAGVADGATATPQLMIDADVDVGQIRVVNDDTVDIGNVRGNRFDGFGRSDEATARAANAKACAR